MILVQSGLGGDTSDEQRRPSLTIQCMQLSTDRPFNACNCCSRKLARMSPQRTLTTHREHLYLQIRFAQWQAGTVSDHIQQPVLTPIFQNSKILSTLQIAHCSLSTIHIHCSLSTRNRARAITLLTAGQKLHTRSSCRYGCGSLGLALHLASSHSTSSLSFARNSATLSSRLPTSTVVGRMGLEGASN